MPEPHPLHHLSTVNGAIPWATTKATTFASLRHHQRRDPRHHDDITAQGSTIADGSTSNLRIITDGTGAAIALGATDHDINTLVQANTDPCHRADHRHRGKTLRVNGVLLASTTNTKGLTIGAAANDGTLTAGTAGGELFLINNSANTLTVNAAIANNTSASTGQQIRHRKHHLRRHQHLHRCHQPRKAASSPPPTAAPSAPAR